MAILLIVGLIVSHLSMGAVYVISPSDDALVANNEWANTNFGSSGNLGVFYRNSNGDTNRIFLKFNLASIPDSEIITYADLKLYCWEYSGDVDIDLHYVSNDSWSKGNITWNNMPGYNANVIDSIPNNLNWRTWSVDTSYITDEDLSLLLKFQSEASTGTIYGDSRSEEYINTIEHPYLSVTTQVIPIPSTVWLLSSCLIGIVGVGGKFKK